MKNINTDLLLKKNTNQILERLQNIVLLQIKGLNRTKYVYFIQIKLKRGYCTAKPQKQVHIKCRHVGQLLMLFPRTFFEIQN